MVRVADYVMEKLVEYKVNHMFTISGRGTLYLTDALAKNTELEAICMHNEQAVSYAAVAYAKSSQQLGACMVTTGCGSTNAISGVLCAWQDEVSCVFLSGQNMLNETVLYNNAMFRTYGSQEADIISVVRPITKYAKMITNTEKVVYEVEKALYLAVSGKKGPVWLDIPLDIQNARIEPDEQEHFKEQEQFDKAKENSFEIDKIQMVIEELRYSHRPVLLIGNGVRNAGAIEELEQFVEKTAIPVTFSHTAVDVYGLEHTLSIGSVGSLNGTRAGNFTVQNADLILVLGCRMTSMTTGEQKDKFGRNAKIITVDISLEEHTKNTYHIDKFVRCDAKVFLDNILSSDIKYTSVEWQNTCKHWKEVFPKCEEKYKQSEKVDLYYLAQTLSNKMRENTQLVCDAGLEQLIIPTSVAYKKGMRCIQPAMQGAMGFALPGTIGIAVRSDKPVIAVIGDGSVMMNLQELQTIHYLNLPVKLFITNNNAYAVIRQRQKELFRKRTIGTDNENGLECADFEKVAYAFGLQYVRIENSRELEEKADKVLGMKGAVLCEVMCVEEQEYLRTSYARNSEKKFVHRPIEDLAPFMNREVFLKEMIIEPIDQ